MLSFHYLVTKYFMCLYSSTKPYCFLVFLRLHLAFCDAPDILVCFIYESALMCYEGDQINPSDSTASASRICWTLWNQVAFLWLKLISQIDLPSHSCDKPVYGVYFCLSACNCYCGGKTHIIICLVVSSHPVVMDLLSKVCASTTQKSTKPVLGIKRSLQVSILFWQSRWKTTVLYAFMTNSTFK